MIFYFSGTGNSAFVATQLALQTKDAVLNLSTAPTTYTLKENEPIGFVFPIYAWSAPQCVLDFIDALDLKNVNNTYAFFVCTCGANCGNIAKVMTKALKKKGLTCSVGFSVIMPENYIVSKFLKVEPKQKQHEKIQKAKELIPQITTCLLNKESVFKCEKGPVPWFTTSVVRPLFQRFAITAKPFLASNKCTKCGVCQKICPLQNITVTDKPKWGNRCALCLACLHRCPEQVIDYGNKTQGKERYFFNENI